MRHGARQKNLDAERKWLYSIKPRSVDDREGLRKRGLFDSKLGDW